MKSTAFWACLFAVSTAALTSCATLIRRPEPGIVIRDQVSACFSLSQEGHVLALVQPKDCYSMRAARVWQKAGTVVVDQQAYAIHFRSEFKLEERSSLGPKLPDCLGGGQLNLDLGELEVGIYEVYSGDQLIGQLSVPSGLPWRDQCMAKSQEH